MIVRCEKVDLSSAVKALTVFILLLVLIVGVIMPVSFIFTAENNAEVIANIILILIIVSAFIPVFMFAPKKVVLTDESIIVKRWYGRAVFPLKEILSVELFESDALGIGTFGVGGVFGFVGRFYSKRLGHYMAYVGNCSKSFFVTMKSGKKYLLSCNNHRALVAQVRDMIQ